MGPGHVVVAGASIGQAGTGGAVRQGGRRCAISPGGSQAGVDASGAARQGQDAPCDRGELGRCGWFSATGLGLVVAGM
uniref:Uncharacterized protein n=1 Tax=Oryza sativa subsp. japonica TaxID=39947 RepID=Q67UR8_ORYSJ|nr:hypothetical protein [Oryza sativa Japonica Group]BAD38101.1 hypothetical protein [Oryza sativa Japonica Group]